MADKKIEVGSFVEGKGFKGVVVEMGTTPDKKPECIVEYDHAPSGTKARVALNPNDLAIVDAPENKG